MSTRTIAAYAEHVASKREREQNYWQERMRIGVELFDLHYGWQPVNKDFVLRDIVEWRWSSPLEAIMRSKFSEMLCAAAHRNNSTYTNKMLILVAEPDHDDYWTAAWAYDGRGFGMVKLMPRYLAPGL